MTVLCLPLPPPTQKKSPNACIIVTFLLLLRCDSIKDYTRFFYVMKINELLKILRDSDCIILRHGGNHDMWKSNKTGNVFAVPRHGSQEVPTGTLKSIWKKAGLPE